MKDTAGAKALESGYITCAICGARAQAGTRSFGMFCSNLECKASEEKELEAQGSRFIGNGE